MKKRILSVLLTFVMVLGLLPTVAFAEGDTTAPTLSGGSATRESKTNATVRFTSSEAGTYYYEVVNKNVPAPSIVTTGEGKTCAVGENTISLTDLANTGAKDIYIAVKDAAGNESGPFKIEIPAYVLEAKIGETSYRTVEAALTAASSNEKADMIEIISEDVTAVNKATLKAGDSIKTYPNENDTKDINKATTDATLDVDGYGTVMFTGGEIEVVEGAALLGGGGSATGKSGVKITNSTTENGDGLVSVDIVADNNEDIVRALGTGKVKIGDTEYEFDYKPSYVIIEVTKDSNKLTSGKVKLGGGVSIIGKSGKVITNPTSTGDDKIVVAANTDKDKDTVTVPANGTVDVALASDNNIKTTYTAVNANTMFAISENDTNTKNIELLDNTKFGFNPAPAAQSALKFTDKNSYTVNGVTYQAQTVKDATTGEDADISYTVTYGTKTETVDGSEEPKTVNANIISVDNGSKVIATMGAESVVMIASGTVGDRKFETVLPFTATNSGASIIIDNTDSQKVNSISANGSNLTPVYDENSEGGADTPDIIGYQVSKNSSSGGSSGGSHKNSNTTTTVPVSGNETSTKVSASVSGNVATVDEIKQTEIEKLGVNGNVTIDLSGMSDSVTGVNLPVATVKNMIDSSAENLEIKLPNADVTIDKTTLNALNEQASSGDLRLVVDNDTEARKTLSAAQETSLSKMNEPKLIEAYFVSGDKRISDFKGGTVSISIALDDDKPVRVWYLKDNGEYEKVDSTYDKKTATLKLKHFSHYVIEQLDESMGYASCSKEATCPIEKFADVVNTAWYHDGVHYCLDNGLMVGTSETSFSPDANITRGQIVTMLWRKDGSPAASGGDFADVASTAYYAQAIAWAASNDIVTGYGDEKFGPDDSITREQLAAILYRYAKYKGMDVSVGEDTNILDFDDAQSISSYAVSAIQWACGAGIMNGTDTLKLSPKATATRAQAACMMQRFLTENK